MVTPDELMHCYYNNYVNLIQAVTESAINDYYETRSDSDLQAVYDCLDYYYNFSIEEKINIIQRLKYYGKTETEFKKE